MESTDRVLARIAASQYGVIRIDQASQLGLSSDALEYRLRGGPWERLHRGVYRNLASPPTWKGTMMAACLTGGEGTAVSHRSAAALMGLPGGSTDLIEITCHRWRRSKYPFLIVHETKRMEPGQSSTIDGIPSTTVERTLLDRFLPSEELHVGGGRIKHWYRRVLFDNNSTLSLLS